MSEKLFHQIFNMSSTGGVVIICVLIARFALKKTSKIFSYALAFVIALALMLGLASCQRKAQDDQMPVNLTPQQISEINAKFEPLIQANEGDRVSAKKHRRGVQAESHLPLFHLLL